MIEGQADRDPRESAIHRTWLAISPIVFAVSIIAILTATDIGARYGRRSR